MIVSASGALSLSGVRPIQGIAQTINTGAVAFTGIAPLVSLQLIPPAGTLALTDNYALTGQLGIIFAQGGVFTFSGSQVTRRLYGPPPVARIPLTLFQYRTTIGFFPQPATIGITMSTTTSVIEQNAIYVQANFIDDNGNPYVPLAVSWLLWDNTNKATTQGYTTITPLGTSVQFTVPGSINSTNNQSNLTERRMVLLQTTLPDSTVRRDNAYYDLVAVPDIPVS